MAHFIKITQKNNVELLIKTGIIKTIFPDPTVEKCRTVINFKREAAKKSFYVQKSVDDFWKMILL